MKIAKIFTCSITVIFLTTEILAVPAAYADDDTIQPQSEALGGLTFGGGARPTSESFGGRAVPIKKLSDEKGIKPGTEEKSESPSPYAWMTPSPLTRSRDKAKAGAEQKMKLIGAKLDLAVQERKTGAFVPALIHKSRDAEDSDVQDIGDLFSDLMKEMPMKFEDEKSEEASEDSAEDIGTKLEDEDEDTQTDDLLADMMKDFSEEDFSDPTANEEKTRTFTSTMIIDEMIKKSQLPENFDDLGAAMKASDSGAEKAAASMQMDVSADGTETPEGEGYWEDVYEYQLDEAVLAEIAALINQIADLTSQKNALQSQSDSLGKQIEDIQKVIDSLVESLGRMNNALNRVNQRIARIQARIDAIEAEIAAKTAEYRELEAQWQQLYAQNVQLDQQARMLRIELVSIPRPTSARRREIQRELRNLTAEFRANIREMNQLRRQGLRLDSQVRRLQRDKRTQDRQLRDAKNDQKNIEANIIRTKDRIARLEQMKRDKQTQQADLERQIQDLGNQINGLNARIADLRTRLYKRVFVGRKWVRTPAQPHSPEEPQVVDEPGTDISRHLVKEITAVDEVTS